MDEKLIKSFIGTFLEGFFELKEEDYLEPALKKEKTEVAIGIMSDAEKRVFTLLVQRYQDINKLALTFGLDEDSLGVLLENEDEKLLERIGDEAELQYEKHDEEFPWQCWQEFIKLLDYYNLLIDFNDSLIYTRLMSKNICPKPILRKGWLIVKDNFQTIEDDGTYEDEEKITNQNRFYN